MNIRDAIYQTVHRAAGGVEALAVRMGLRVQILRNKANPNSATNYLSPLELDALMELTGDYAVLHALAQNHGHVCLRVDVDSAPSDMAVLELVTKVWSASGEVGAEVHATLADGVVERHEVARVKAAVYRVNHALEQMVLRLEGMAEK
jgi:hypothetical protein